jgi:hypothetical protein
LLVCASRAKAEVKNCVQVRVYMVRPKLLTYAMHVTEFGRLKLLVVCCCIL